MCDSGSPAVAEWDAVLRETASLGFAAREMVKEVKIPTQIAVVGMRSTALLYSQVNPTEVLKVPGSQTEMEEGAVI
jgi:hypothetical protein